METRCPLLELYFLTIHTKRPFISTKMWLTLVFIKKDIKIDNLFPFSSKIGPRIASHAFNFPGTLSQSNLIFHYIPLLSFSHTHRFPVNSVKELVRCFLRWQQKMSPTKTMLLTEFHMGLGFSCLSLQNLML